MVWPDSAEWTGASRVSRGEAAGLSRNESQGSDAVRLGGADKACAATGGLRGAAEDCFPPGSTPARSRGSSQRLFRSCPGCGRPGAESEKLRLLDFGLWVSEIIGMFRVGGFWV